MEMTAAYPSSEESTREDENVENTAVVQAEDHGGEIKNLEYTRTGNFEHEIVMDSEDVNDVSLLSDHGPATNADCRSWTTASLLLHETTSNAGSGDDDIEIEAEEEGYIGVDGEFYPEFEVKGILDRRCNLQRKKLSYLVNWGSPYKPNWEPLSHLAHCVNLVVEFEAMAQDKGLPPLRKDFRQQIDELLSHGPTERRRRPRALVEGRDKRGRKIQAKEKKDRRSGTNRKKLSQLTTTFSGKPQSCTNKRYYQRQ